ncbi:MAG: thymidine kinase [Bacteroidales bacterium]|nr:thymidine kinase [Bacteroidales bacterium]
MFLENKANRNLKRGWIEVVCGSMFSGKTEELLRRIKRATFANQQVELFKPAIDIRYDEEEVVSHDANSMQSTPVHNSAEILLYVNMDTVEVVGIDEVQFFDDGVVDVCNQLANNGIRVIVAGLDMDYLGKPFGCMPKLLAVAEYVTKTHAICVKCGDLAQFSHRLVPSDRQVLLGEKDSYEPLCRHCYNEAVASSSETK